MIQVGRYIKKLKGVTIRVNTHVNRQSYLLDSMLTCLIYYVEKTSKHPRTVDEWGEFMKWCRSEYIDIPNTPILPHFLKNTHLLTRDIIAEICMAGDHPDYIKNMSKTFELNIAI